MRGRQHFQISVLSGLILVSPFLLSDTEVSMLFLIGLFLGSFLPDSDASDRTAKHKESVLFAFDAINEFFIYPVLLRIFNEKKRHRGILHTIVGVFIFSLLLTIITGLTFFFFKIQFNFWIIGIGLFAGGLLHLMEDCCTFSGVNPFYPKMKQYVLKGNISTNNLQDKRPDQYSQYLGFLFVSLLVVSIWFHISQIQMIFFSVLTLILSWIVFLLICRVHKGQFR